MSIRFAIQNTLQKAEKEGDAYVRFSGHGEPFHRVSERTAEKVGEDATGKPLLAYVTGLNPNKVDFFGWYSDEEKKKIKKDIKELTPLIEQRYGGTDVLSERNQYFWKQRDVGQLSLTHDDIDVFYDTKNPSHALLYLSIISGAFIDLVAPNKEWAERHQVPHYLALDTEEVYDDEDDLTRSDAHAELGQIRKDDSPEALYILAWCVLYETNAFGAINRSTPVKHLAGSLVQFIDGKLSLKRKRNTPKQFIEYAEKWKGQQTRPGLYTEAYIKAGEYFNFIQKKAKKYATSDGTELGNTIQEAVENLMKPKFQSDLEKLRDLVEAKWKE